MIELLVTALSFSLTNKDCCIFYNQTVKLINIIISLLLSYFFSKCILVVGMFPFPVLRKFIKL